MSKTKETLDKAYGNVPKEVQYDLMWDWISTRGFRYYYLTFFRKLFR